MSFDLEFYDDPETGRLPVLDWIKNDLTPYQRRAIGVAMSEVLQKLGIDVCKSHYGQQLGDGLFEFRLRHDADEIIAKHTNKTPAGEPDDGKILLRVFCHAHGNRLILLLGGYDKEADPSDKRQDKEIKLARKRLTEYTGR